MITLYGASGYTGKLIAAVLEREGFPYRLAGRSEAKLRQLSQALPSHPAWVLADASLPSSLPPIFKDTHLVINCAGPFTDLGERVLSMAAISGVHYLDTTNELGFVYRTQGYQNLARKSGAALVPSCAFEVAFADCAAALLALDCPGPYQSIDVVYHLSGEGASRGTRLSALRSLATSWIAYRDGSWVGEVPGGRRRWFPLPSGRRPALSFPSSESVTLPNHLQTRQVSTWMAGAPFSTYFETLLVPLFARFLRTLAGRPILWAVSRAGSPRAIRSKDPFEIFIQLQTERGGTAGCINGTGAYELTAEIIVFAVKQILSPGFTKSGILPPARLFNPADFIAAAAGWGVSWIILPGEQTHA